MKRIKKSIGSLVLDNGRIYDIKGDYTDEGYVYKDWDAFESGEGICYISELELNEVFQELTDLKAIYENANPGDENYMSDEQYREAREEIILGAGETRTSIIDQIRCAYEDSYLLTEEQIEHIARSILYEADWACIATYLTDDFTIDDIIEFDDYSKKKVFRPEQYEAVMAGMTPKEYQEKKECETK